MALAGRLERNLARTMPLLPWARVTFPQITRVLLGLPPGVTVLLGKRRHRTAQQGSHSSAVTSSDNVVSLRHLDNLAP